MMTGALKAVQYAESFWIMKWMSEGVEEEAPSWPPGSWVCGKCQHTNSPESYECDGYHPEQEKCPGTYYGDWAGWAMVAPEQTPLLAAALNHYEHFHGLPEGAATLQDLNASSAGLLGWALMQHEQDDDYCDYCDCHYDDYDDHDGDEHDDDHDHHDCDDDDDYDDD